MKLLATIGFIQWSAPKSGHMRIFFMLVIVLAVTGSCKKAGPGMAGPVSLNGKWKYVEYYASIGGPGNWYPASPANQWIEIKGNGDINSNMSSFNGVTGYQLQDAVTIKFMMPSAPGGFWLFRYNIDTLLAQLVMSPVNPACIEGCAIKFKRD